MATLFSLIVASNCMREHSTYKIRFFEFLNREISISDFEKWIYDNSDLESEIGNDFYTDLISFDFKSHDLIPFISGLVEKCFDWFEYEKWRTIRLLSMIKDGKIEIVLASRKLRQLYLDQEDKLGKSLVSIGLAIGYESELDRCPIESEYHLYNKLTLKSMLEPVDWYKSDFLKLAEQELEELINPDLKTIDLDLAVNIKHLHEIFMEHLDFPDFYGKNWDAFWDAITGLVEMPKELRLANWSGFEKKFEKESKILKQIITDFNKEMTDKQIVITTAGNTQYSQ